MTETIILLLWITSVIVLYATEVVVFSFGIYVFGMPYSIKEGTIKAIPFVILFLEIAYAIYLIMGIIKASV